MPTFPAGLLDNTVFPSFWLFPILPLLWATLAYRADREADRLNLERTAEAKADVLTA